MNFDKVNDASVKGLALVWPKILIRQIIREQERASENSSCGDTSREQGKLHQNAETHFYNESVTVDLDWAMTAFVLSDVVCLCPLSTVM